MFSLQSTRIKTALAVFVLAVASAGGHAQINPNQIDWPTGASGCVYAPGSNTCVAPSGGGTPGGSSGQFQYNAASSFAGTTYTYYAQSGDTISSIEALCGAGKALYIVDLAQTFTLGASHALNSCVTVKFNPQGSWTVNGATFTLSNVQVDSSSTLNTHFIAGTGSMTLANGYPSQVPIEWAGGVNDGNVGANTGTDNTAAWSLIYPMVSTGTVMFQCGSYRFANAGPAITKSYFALGTTCSYATQNGSPNATLFSSSASATVISFTGTNSSSPIYSNALTGLSVARGVVPATGSIGVQAYFAFGFLARFNKVWDSSIGWDVDYAPSDITGGFYNNDVADGYAKGQGAGPYIAWNLTGDSRGFQSMTGQSNGVDFNNSVLVTALTYGMKITGVLQDLNWDSFNASSPDYGIYISSATFGQDVHFTNSTLDGCFVDCIYINGLTANTVEFRGGWIDVARTGQTAGVELISSSGITIADNEIHSVKQAPDIYNHGSVAGVNTITGNRFYFGSGSYQSIYSNAGTTLNITGNTIDGGGNGFGPIPQIQFVGQSNSTILSNTIVNTSGGIGISFDASSNNNCCANLNKLQTFTISDAGTGNELTPPTAWGSITGTLSAQTDLNTALGLKAPLASPTFTGTPAAPTAAPGTNTTQLASTAFVQAAVTGGTLPAQAADTVVMNATGSSAVPSAVAMPTCTTGADLYNTTAHAWSCVSGGTGALTQIAKVVATGSSATMSFTSIPGTFTNLKLICSGRSSQSASSEPISVQYNSDAGSHYTVQYVQGTGGGASSAYIASTTSAAVGNFSAGTAPAGSAGSVVIDIPNYAGTTFNKQGLVVNYAPFSSSTAGVITAGHEWASTSAITAIAFNIGAGNFVSGSTCTLYGLQ